MSGPKSIAGSRFSIRQGIAKEISEATTDCTNTDPQKPCNTECKLMAADVLSAARSKTLFGTGYPKPREQSPPFSFLSLANVPT